MAIFCTLFDLLRQKTVCYNRWRFVVRKDYTDNDQILIREANIVKYLRQFGIILAVTCVGEIMKYFIPLPIPGSIYGLILMFVLLMAKVIKVEHVKETGEFLIEIMPMMFIPAGVGLLNAWDTLKPVLIPIIVILFVSTIVVMGVSGKVTQTMIEAEERKKNEGHSE